MDFEPADPETTGQVMQFRVVPGDERRYEHPAEPARPAGDRAAGAATGARGVSLNEEDSATVRVEHRRRRQHRPGLHERRAVRPIEADLGTVNPDGSGQAAGVGRTDHREARGVPPRSGRSTTSPRTRTRSTSTRSSSRSSTARRIGRSAPARPPESWETGRKDTVIAYPGEMTRVKALFDRPGLFVWHCHILEHEDNEMMRPYRIGP